MESSKINLNFKTGQVRIYDGECYYDDESNNWIHMDKPKCQHKDVLSPDISKEQKEMEANIVNEKLIEIVKNPDNFQDGIYDLTEYAKLWDYLELPRGIYPEYTLGIDDNSSKVILCTRKRAISLIGPGPDRGFAFKYI